MYVCIYIFLSYLDDEETRNREFALGESHSYVIVCKLFFLNIKSY